jgi:hypothetical protein
VNDVEIRRMLHAALRAEAKPGRIVLDELGILQGTVRADVVAVDYLLRGFEIKSANDSRTRLARQVAGYNRVFDRATLVTEAGHLRGALPTIPDWWGVFVATPEGLEVCRAPERNPEVEPRAVVELLWAEDVIGLLEQRHAARGYRGKPRRVLWDRLCEVYSGGEIRGVVRDVLRARYGSLSAGGKAA